MTTRGDDRWGSTWATSGRDPMWPPLPTRAEDATAPAHHTAPPQQKPSTHRVVAAGRVVLRRVAAAFDERRSRFAIRWRRAVATRWRAP